MVKYLKTDDLSCRGNFAKGSTQWGAIIGLNNWIIGYIGLYQTRDEEKNRYIYYPSGTNNLTNSVVIR